ncbi:MAG TPA: ABC transporter transmembrane domain-containing protein [Gaiellaceae bacterium]
MRSARHVLAPFLRRQWRALAVAAVSTVVVAAAEVLRPFPLKFVIDHLFAGGTAPDSFDLGRDEFWLLAGVAGLVLAIALMEAAGGYLMDVRLMRAGERIVHDLRVAIYAHLQRLSLGYHQRRHAGDLVTRVTGDVNAVGTVFSSSLGTLVSAGLTLIGMIVVGFILDPVLALVAFASAPLLAVIAFRFRRRMRLLARRQRAMEGEIASLAAEALTSIQQVKALGSERHEHERLERKSEERLEAGYEATLVEGRFTRVLDIVGALATAAVLVVGVFRVEAGALSPGDLIVMVAYARRVYRPLRAMSREWVRLSRAMARAERVAEVLSADEILEERGRAQPEAPARGRLEFERVSFAYDVERPALRDVALTITAGQRVAVVGRSGAGKSTLAALAARFYDPGEGRVLLDGADLRDYPLGWLRDQVGLVLQHPVLFTGTVAENIAWGIDAIREDVVRAARAVGADPFISQLPDGYDTKLDPGGTGLSGGQRQRIAIARTLLRDPAILILDEPTTGLDAESEAEVLAGLEVLMRERTTVIVSHVLGLAMRAERVVVLEGGRVVQTGAPTELLMQEGAFRRLAVEQGLDADQVEGLVGLVDGLAELGTSLGTRLSDLAGKFGQRRPRQPAPGIFDPELPHARVMLDPDAVAQVLERSFDGRTPLDVSVRYLRYKPGTNLVVHYTVAANGARHDAVGMIVSGGYLARRAAKPENVALARLVAPRVPAAEALAYDADVGCLVQWYPLDLSLPTLASPPDQLRRLLGAAGVPVEDSDEEPHRLAYKPRRRAVLRVDGHVIKLYRREDEFERALAGQRAASTLGFAPEFDTSLPDRLVTVQSLLAGSAVPSAATVAEEAGALLAGLQASQPDGLSAFGPDAQLQAAAASARLVGTIAPELRPRLDRLQSSLAASMPEDVALVPSHGDFNARQLLLGADGLAVTDFDEFCLAPAALDPATYAAYLVRGRRGDLDEALAALEELTSGYGGRPAHLSWFLATMILRRAARPFRYFEADWRPRVEEMVAAAEGAIAT